MRVFHAASRGFIVIAIALIGAALFAEESADASVVTPAEKSAPAEKGAEIVRYSFNLRFYGIDFIRTSVHESPLPSGGDLELLTAAGGGIISRNFYRNADGTRRPEASTWPGFSAPTSEAALRSLSSDIWIRLTQYIDEGNNFRAFAYGRSRTIANLAADASVTPTLFFAGLPEAAGSFENSLGMGLGYTAITEPGGAWSREGISADLCYEASLDLFTADLSTAFVHELSGEFSAFVPLYEGDRFHIAFREHALASALLGDDIPEARLSSLGGNRYLPYWALGGIVRGVDDNAGDGRLKAANNIEIAFTFPTVFKSIAVPTLAAFFDAGIADDGAFQPDPGSLRLTTGAYANVELFGFNLFAGGALNVLTGRIGPIIGVGAHF